MKTQKLCLIDGANCIFRAFYAIRHLSNSKGFPTGALYGFTQMLLKLLREERPDFVAVCFDTPELTFRDELYEEYKANRPEPPDDLVPQFPYFRPIVEALGVPALEKPGFEADDLIGTLAKRYASQGMDVVIVSSDKDLMQLIGPGISMLDGMKGARIGPREVEEKFGVGPEGVVEVLGLAGDASDNVPGVPGVGPKTAAELIRKYGTVEGVIAHADELRGALAGKIRDNAEQARLSRRLVEIDTHVAIDADEGALARCESDQEKLRELFSEFEFTKLLADLAPKPSLDREGYRLVTDDAGLAAAIDGIRKAGIVAIDIVAEGADPMRAEVLGVALAWGAGEAAYVPLARAAPDVPAGATRELFEPAPSAADAPQLASEAAARVLAPLLADEGVRKAGHDLNRAMMLFAQKGWALRGAAFDSMLASYVLDPGGDNALDALARKHLDHQTIAHEAVVGKGRAQISFADVEVEAARDYACEGADVAFRLHAPLSEGLAREGLHPLFEGMEMPLVEVLVAMQLAGVRVDAAQLARLEGDFSKRLALLEKEIHALAGETFNINSPKQLGQVLFEKLKLPGGKRTKTGFSTNQDILEQLAIEHELPRLVLDYRSLAKLKGTYIDALPALIHPATGRVHTTFHQAVTATGRLSSSDPNLQNIPARGEEGRRIREAFVADEGFQLLSADYSQIELRVLAHLSCDATLVEAFRKGQDVHAITAAGIFGVPPEEVTAKQRAAGKTVNFATIYGQGPYGLSRQLAIDVDEAAAYIENYFRRYPGVAAYRDDVLARARREGKVETLFGRRRFFPDISSANAALVQVSARMAFNTVFQGTAADIIKRAMIAIHAGFPQVSERSRMILQVHDELLFEVPEGEIEAVRAFVVREMEGAAELSVPLIVDVGTGGNWAEAH